MIDKLIKFAQLAANVAVENQQSIDLFNLEFKSDLINSVVTKTDIEISKLFHEFVKQNFSDLNYVIIDEETIDELGDNKFEKVRQAEYQFVIDPIDGTHTYALNTPNYAISVGVLKNNRPFMGVICLPYSNEIVACDGKNSFYIKNDKKILIERKEISKMSFIFDNTWWVKINDKYNKRTETIINLYSCVVHFFYMATHRGRGYYFRSYIWDMAGSWPILRNLGFEFYNYDNMEILNIFDEQNFDEKFRIKNLHIVCRENDLNHLKEITDFRN